MRSLLGTVIWVVGFSLSSLYVCPAVPFWLEEFLLKDQLLSLWGSPCGFNCCFSLAAFIICSLCLSQCKLQGFNLLDLSLPEQFPLLYLFWLPLFALQYLTSALTQVVKGGHLFRLTCSVMLRRGRNTANKYHWRVWGVLVVSGSHWVCPHSQSVCFPGLHCSGSRLLCRVTV